MICPGTYEEEMLTHEINGDYKNAIKDTVAVLEQEGYTAGAKVFESMVEKLLKRNEGETK